MIKKEEEQPLVKSFTIKPEFKKVNEDYYAYVTTNISGGEKADIFVIADGMGGHDDGEAASLFAVQHILAWWKAFCWEHHSLETFFQCAQEQLKEQFHLINDRLISIGDIENKKIGTTLIVFIMVQNKYIIVHVGDSAVYQYKAAIKIQEVNEDTIDLLEFQSLHKLTIDHVKQIKQKNGALSSNMLTQCIGVQGEVNPFIKTGDYLAGDRFLLATDGVMKVLSQNEMTQILKENNSIDEKIKVLYEHFNKQSIQDDVTAVLIFG